MSVIIRLQNLPISANASNIRRFFGGLSIPEGGVHIVGGSEGDAFIAFATDEDARKAMLLDRQSINGAPVRLFLSSKTEMQSIIESARSSALFSGVGATQSSQQISQKTETMHALDVTAPTLPSSFPSYRNGGSRDGFSNESSSQFSYPYTKSGIQPMETMDRVPDVPPCNKNDFSPDIPREKITNERPPERERPYYAAQPVAQSSRFSDPTPMHDYPPPRDVHMHDRNQMYRSYYNEYDYNRRPPVVNHDEHFMQRGKDNGLRESTRDHYSDHYSRPVSNDMPPDYPKYPHAPSPRSFSDRFPSEISRDSHRANVPYPSDARGVMTRPSDCESNYSNSRVQEERDFSVRPSWLSEDMAVGGPKRPFPQVAPDFDEYPSRKRRAPPPNRPAVDRPSGETDFVIKVTLPIAEVNIKTIFEILKGVHIVPKWGIRIEEDTLQRPTGYVFIMVTSIESYERALSFDSRGYKGEVIKVVQSSLDEFYNVTDSNFSSKCPPDVAKKLPPLHQISPPYHSDGCLELTDLPVDTTKQEVVRFLGAPGLTPDNVALIRTSIDKTICMRALVTLPSVNDIKILLSAKPRPFRPDGSPPVNLNPISKPQLIAYSKSTSIEKSNFHQEPEKLSQPPDAANDQPKQLGLMTCAYITGLSRPLKDPEVLRLFPGVLIPGDAIHMGSDGVTAYVDFISENNCRRAINEVAEENSKAKQAHPLLQIEGLTRSEMDSRLGLANKSSEYSYHRPPRRDRDPRETCIQWESRPRPTQHRPNSRSAASRPNIDDGYYTRQLSAQQFDEFHNDQHLSRRPRLVTEKSHSSMVPPIANVTSRQPLGPSHRRPGNDFITVFVGNFPPTFTADQLAAVMRDYYFIPGSIRMRRDPKGQLTGEAQVDFTSSYEADRALRDLNGYRVAGRPLVLRFDHRN